MEVPTQLEWEALIIPRYFQREARDSKMGKRLGGFLPRPGMIPEVDCNCSCGPEPRQGQVKECLKVEKLHKIWDSRGWRIQSSGNSNRSRPRRSNFSNFWPCRASRQWELPVAGSRWPSGTNYLECQLTEDSEEPHWDHSLIDFKDYITTF